MSRKIIILISVFTTFWIIILFLLPDEEQDRCQNQDYFRRIALDGVVKGKYLDLSDHSVPTIVVSNINYFKLDTVSFFGDFSNLFNDININDTIIKKKLDLSLYKRNRGVKLLGVVNFHCHELPASN